MKQHKEYLQCFYKVLDKLDVWALSDCGKKPEGMPKCGVYFFFEPGEFREDGKTKRVVRVGTHAIDGDSKTTTVWTRLRQHRGRADFSGGNHRSSVFRKLIGKALMKKYPERKYSSRAEPSWCYGSSRKDALQKMPRPTSVNDIKEQEARLEREVSQRLKEMEVLVVPVPCWEKRKSIERGAIGLLSQAHNLCPPSKGWLGNHSDNEKVKSFGLWNRRHVNGGYDPEFLKDLAHYAKATTFKFPKSS